MEAKQAAFEGWAVVEIYGHQKEVGFVTTEYYGMACMFRVDVPALPEREFILKRPEYTNLGSDEYRVSPVGSKVKRAAIPGRSRLVGVGAIFSLTPCTEATAIEALESLIPRTLMLLELPKDQKQLTVNISDRLPGEPQDRTFNCCGGNPEDGHADDCVEEFEEEEI